MFNQYDTPSDEEVMRKAKLAVKNALEMHKVAGVPSVIYDRKTKAIYELHADGKKVFIANKMLKGTYSEWCEAKEA